MSFPSQTIENSNESQFSPKSQTPPTFEDLLDNYISQPPQRGQYMQGEVIHIDDEGLFVDVGSKRDAVVPHDEVNRLADEYLDSLSAGDSVPVYVLRTPVGDEQLLVSVEKGLQLHDWTAAEGIYKDEEILYLPIIGHNKGGLVVKYRRLQGFIPNSHIPAFRHISNQQELIKQKEQQVGEQIAVKIIEVDRKQERLVFSATAAHKEQQAKRLISLSVGDIIEGRVIKLVHYGAFVDLDGVDGLLHISKISWDRIGHPREKLQAGDLIDVQIDEIDVEQKRISLNRKAILPSPWEAFTVKQNEGDLVEGTVVSIVDFGAFVVIDDGIEGLAHISEINMSADGTVSDVFAVGDTVLTRILNIDVERKRLSLSTRQVSATEELLWMAKRAESN